MKSLLIFFVFFCLNLSFSQTSPGGVSSNLSVWLKANAGASSTFWNDQSGNLNDLTVGSSTYNVGSTTQGINYNPVQSFNGTDQVLHTVDNTIIPQAEIMQSITYNHATSYFIVFRRNLGIGCVLNYSDGAGGPME